MKAWNSGDFATPALFEHRKVYIDGSKVYIDGSDFFVPHYDNSIFLYSTAGFGVMVC